MYSILSLHFFSSAHCGRYFYSVQDSLRGGNYPGSNALQTPVADRTSNKTEVVVHTAHVQYPTSDTNRDAIVDEHRHGHCGSSTSISNEDLERGAES
jgi:hypothetical protein